MSARIILVDDDPEVHKDINIFLKALGLEPVESCFNSSQARDKINEKNYDVMIVDEYMPGELGHELLKSLGVEKPKKVFMLTNADVNLLDRILTNTNVIVDGIFNKFDFYSKMANLIKT